MKKPDSILLLLGAALISACTAGLKPDSTLPNPQTVRQIRLELDSSDLASSVARNLQSWDYPVTAEVPSSGVASTHILSARLGSIEQASTPAGFSFHRGNSDPRALDFQKARVIPVTCTLRSVPPTQESASLTLRFTAKPDQPDDRNTRIDRISTACYNLLSDLRIPHRTDDSDTSSRKASSWMPEVRIEIKEKPAIPATATPASRPATAVKPAPSTEAPASPEAAPARPAPLQTEQQTREGRKQIIIHNQGAPVILEFGYDRQ